MTKAHTFSPEAGGDVGVSVRGLMLKVKQTKTKKKKKRKLCGRKGSSSSPERWPRSKERAQVTVRLCCFLTVLLSDTCAHTPRLETHRQLHTNTELHLYSLSLQRTSLRHPLQACGAMKVRAPPGGGEVGWKPAAGRQEFTARP